MADVSVAADATKASDETLMVMISAKDDMLVLVVYSDPMVRRVLQCASERQ